MFVKVPILGLLFYTQKISLSVPIGVLSRSTEPILFHPNMKFVSNDRALKI